MSVYRKESNSLVPKAGLGIIDNIFNRFSNHAISNAKTTEALILRNVMYDESDGKLYKVGIDGTKGEEIKMGMPLLDYANPLHKFGTTLTYTANQDCYLTGSISGVGGQYNVPSVVTINNNPSYQASVTGSTTIPPIKLQAGDTVTCSINSSYLGIYKEI